MNPRLTLLLALMFLVGGGLYIWLKSAAPQMTAPPPIAVTAAPNAASPKTASAKTAKPVPPTAQPLVLAVSWEPAFCEGAPNKPECTSQGPSRFDADHFALHGLWPDAEYCGVSATQRQRDEDGQWAALPPVELDAATSAALDRAMPGTRSQLERHEWLKHGTCFGGKPDPYFGAAIALLDGLNQSAVRTLFAKNIGKRLSATQVRAAFDTAFGAGAGSRVRLACRDDGKRQLIAELTIALEGGVDASPDLGALIGAADGAGGGCAGGIVDPVGWQ